MRQIVKMYESRVPFLVNTYASESVLYCQSYKLKCITAVNRNIARASSGVWPGL